MDSVCHMGWETCNILPLLVSLEGKEGKYLLQKHSENASMTTFGNGKITVFVTIKIAK